MTIRIYKAKCRDIEDIRSNNIVEGSSHIPNFISTPHLRGRGGTSNATMAPTKMALLVTIFALIVSLGFLAEMANTAEENTFAKVVKDREIEIFSDTEEFVRSITLPKVKGNTKVCIGRVDYKISRQKVRKFKGSSSVKTTSNGFILNVARARIEISGRWSWQHTNIQILKDAQRFTMKGRRGKLTVTFKLKFRPNGKIKVTVKKCKFDIGSFNVKFNGDTPLLHKLLRKVFERKLKQGIERGICKRIKRDLKKRLRFEILSDRKERRDKGKVRNL